MSEYSIVDEEEIDFDKERPDVYKKLKDCFDFFARVMVNEEENIVCRMRAGKALSETAKTLRFYLLDEEKVEEMYKELEEIKKEMARRKSKRRRN